MSKTNNDEFVTFLFNWAQKQGGFQSALDFMNANKVPRKYRRVAKLIKKFLRGWIRVKTGQSVQPIAAKHFARR